MSERALDLLRRNRIRLRRAVQQHADALAAGAKLAHAIEQPLRVAHRRHVGIRHEEHLVRGVERRDRAGIDLAAGVHEDVFVLPVEQPEQLFDRAAVRRARPIELIGAGENLEPRLVLDHELLQEFAIEPVQVVDRVEDAVARAHAEEQRDFAEARLQVHDDGRALAEPRELDAAVHRDGRRPRAALGAEEHQRRRRRAARPAPSRGAPPSGGWRRGRSLRRAAT